MKLETFKRPLGAWIALFTMVLLAAAAPAIAADRTARRVVAGRAEGGLTILEQVDRQQALHRELSAVIPAGVSRSPVSVAINDEDREFMAERAPSGTAPLRVGMVKPIDGAIGKPFGKAFNHGVISRNKNGSFVWAVTVESPGAQAIRLQLTNFSLPENTEMFFVAANGQAHGPYVGTGRNGNGEFWTRSIASDSGEIVLRYNGTTPRADRGKMSFVISQLAHIAGRGGAKLDGVEKSHDSWPCRDNVSCLVDVNCPEGMNTETAAAEDAVAKLEWITGQSVNTCSGGLLADTDAGSQIPYFLTAGHCFTSSISNMETFFNYVTDSCEGGCPDTIVTGGSPPSASTVGITVVATGSAADFTLTTLDQAPPAGAVFLPWNNTPIHGNHGDPLYRVSNANFGPQVYSQHDVDANTGTCTGWDRGPRIYSKDITGATMGGSSGSPVLNAAGEVVGQLSGCCGFNCGNECDSANNWTVDGAFANYWNQVSQFLDPQPACTTDPECDDGDFCTGTETCNSGTCNSSGDPCIGGTTCNESTDQCDQPVCDNDGACEAGEDCNNCPNDCRQKTNGSPRSRYCCDGDLPDCGNANCSGSGWTCGGGAGSCTVDADCDDGQFCNGAETCSGGSCQSGADPCPGLGCDEQVNGCVTCGGNKAPCSLDSDCCSNNCKNQTCKGN